MRKSARIYDVRMAQFVLKIEKLVHIIRARESRDLRSPSPIMAPVKPDSLLLEARGTQRSRETHNQTNALLLFFDLESVDLHDKNIKSIKSS